MGGQVGAVLISEQTSTVWEFFGKKDGDGSHAGFEIQWSIDM